MEARVEDASFDPEHLAPSPNGGLRIRAPASGRSWPECPRRSLGAARRLQRRLPTHDDAYVERRVALWREHDEPGAGWQHVVIGVALGGAKLVGEQGGRLAGRDASRSHRHRYRK